MAQDTSEFRFRHPVAVRFKDIDVGGHAHHSHALVYFEEARAAYWSQVAGRQGIEEVDFILAEASIRYHRRVLYPATLQVGVRVAVLGKKHFVMEYRAHSDTGELLVSGSTTQVMFDYATGTTVRMADELRLRIEAYEGGEGG